MIPSATLAGLLSCAALSATAGGGADVIPPARSYCKKVFSMPAFFQRDSRFGELPGGGEKYCAPVAASNALVWLDRNGCPGLVPAGGDEDRAQFEMIRLLGSASYMRTSARRGSHPLDMMDGLAKYVGERGYEARSGAAGLNNARPADFGRLAEIGGARAVKRSRS